MANTFLRKTSREIGANLTIVGNYTVPANVGAVVVGLCVSNITTDDIEANVVIDNGISSYYIVNSAPITDGSSLVVAGRDQKLILQTGDSIKINSSAADSIDVVMSIMETDSVGLTDDGGGGGPTAAFDATDPTDFTFITYGAPAPGTGEFDVVIDAGSPLHAFLSATDITGYTVDVYEGSTVFSQTVISSTNPAAQFWEINVTNFSATGNATRLVFFAP
jgi:hypothetical protein